MRINNAQLILSFVLIILVLSSIISTNILASDCSDYASCIAAGNANMNDEDYDEAIEAYTKGIEFDPNVAEAYTIRGKAYSVKSCFICIPTSLEESIGNKFSSSPKKVVPIFITSS